MPVYTGMTDRVMDAGLHRHDGQWWHSDVFRTTSPHPLRYLKGSTFNVQCSMFKVQGSRFNVQGKNRVVRDDIWMKV